MCVFSCMVPASHAHFQINNACVCNFNCQGKIGSERGRGACVRGGEAHRDREREREGGERETDREMERKSSASP